MLKSAVAVLIAVTALLALTRSFSYAMQGLPAQSLSQAQPGQPNQAYSSSSEPLISISRADAKTQRLLPRDVRASPLPADALTHTTYLPAVARNMCKAPARQPAPIGVEIAAIHQITSSMTGGNQTGRLTSAQWRAYLDSAFPTLVAALRDSGAGWTRVNFAWDYFEPVAPVPGQQPQYVWGWYDPKIQAISALGVQIIATVNWAPAWAADPQCGPLKPGRLADYGQFMTDLVKHYMQPPYNIKHWEIKNEPDWWATDSYAAESGYSCFGSHTAEYAQLLAEAYRAIKSVDPQATVIMGGLAFDAFTEQTGHEYYGFYRYFIDQVVAAGGATSTDAFALHYFPAYAPEWERWVFGSQDRQGALLAPACGPDIYDKTWTGPRYEPWGKDIGAKFTHFTSRIRTCYGVDKPVWITEIGEHGYPDRRPNETDQARYVIKGIVRSLAFGAKNVIWYGLATPYDQWEEQLLRNDFTPKPGFFAFKTMAAELKGYEYTSSINTSNLEAHVFSAPCQPDLMVGWGSGILPLRGAHLRVVDYLGNVSSVNDGGAGDQDRLVNSSIAVQLTDDPVFLQVTG